MIVALALVGLLPTRCRITFGTIGLGLAAALGSVLSLGCAGDRVELVAPKPRSTESSAKRLSERALDRQSAAPAATELSAREYLEEGKAYEDKKQNDEAIKAYTRAIEADPKLMEAYYRRALVYQRKELLAAAIMDLDHVLEASPDFINALYARGVSYSRLEKHEEAIQDLTRVIAQAEENPEAYHERGKSHLAMQNLGRALKDFNQALSLNPDHPSGYFYRGLTRYWQGQYNNAVMDYTRALLYDPNSVASLVNRCWALALLGRAEKAKEDCEQALALNPESPHAHDASAFVSWQLGDKKAALDALARAKDLDDEFMAPHERYEEFPIYLAKSLLKAAGYDPGPVDEKIDQRTRTAIQNFQNDRKLRVTGEISEALLDELRNTKQAQYLHETRTP